MIDYQTSLYGNIKRPIFITKLTPTMTREQIKRSLIDALKKNGITVPQGKDKNGKGGAA